MEGSIADYTGVGMAPAISPEAETEQRLADEIRELWAIHVAAKTTVKKTKEEIKATRQRLSERLYEMKQLLAKPGKNGGWSSFLRSQGIAKATADRLVRAHEKPIGPHPNVVSEQVSEPSRDDVGRFIDSLWPKLDRNLPTPKSAYHFLWWFVGYSGLPYEMQKNGILVIDPTANSQKESSSTAATLVPTESVAGDVSSGHVL